MGMSTAARVALSLALAVLTLTVLVSQGHTQPPGGDKSAKTEGAAAQDTKPKLGLLVNEANACQGYTLLAPTFSTSTYLIDLQGRVVQTWKSDCLPGQSAYLLPNGNLLRSGQVKNPPFFMGGAGGRVQEFTWDGKILWDYTFSNEKQLSHHDICKLPNGNVLLIVAEKKTAKEATAAGRRPETVGDGHITADSLYEVQPTGEKTGKIVWEWHIWDHLIQDFDSMKENFGDVGAHPERIDANFGEGVIAAMVAKPEELDKLRAIGYVGAAGRKPQRVQPDWTHTNSVAYNAELDQVMVSVHEFSEFWIIDHSTTTEEAARHEGGRHGKGGDLLYRWGNPRAYRAGTIKEQKLFGQHNAQWIARGLPGEAHVLVFNNGMRRTGGAYSSVDEMVLPVNARGDYEYTPGKAFGPDGPVWTYVAPKRTDFFAGFISGAERLTNGNTLICSGTNGTVFEVTPKGETVWKYVNPEKGSFGGPPMGGPPPMAAPPRPGQILASFLQGILNCTPEQKKQLEAAEKEIVEKISQMLTDEQKKILEEKKPPAFGPGFFAEMPQPGQIMATAVAERLKLTEEQKKQLAELQKDADGKLDTILEEKQKKQLKEMKDGMRAFAGGPPPAGPPGGGPPGAGGPPPGGPPGGPRGFGPMGFGGPGGGGGLFRAPRYAPDYPGLAGKTLTAGKTLDELQPKDPPKEPKDK
jgi:hypothetical protein